VGGAGAPPTRSLLLALLALLPACWPGDRAPDATAGPGAGAEAPRPRPTAPDSAALLREDHAADSAIVADRLRLARERGLDSLATGPLMAELGRTFVGTPYVPQTLETDGEERLVINLRALDCVTFVENVLALARTIRVGGDFPEFTRELERIRYRTGSVAGYPSRLHYFSEWISANAEKGVVTDVTRELGGIRDAGPLDFMTLHRDAYRQLADDSTFEQIRRIETRLASAPRFFIPAGAIAAASPRIRDGDIIAATSSLPGLDVAHTGLALWQDGALHLMHAPLVGDSVEISEQPLAVRIQRIRTQDGIMVARPR
jgi:hypothetical protein